MSDDVTTMLLTPLIAETVNIPVVTVGGIADGRSVAAALTLGAAGVMMASRFIATQECEVCRGALSSMRGYGSSQEPESNKPLQQTARPSAALRSARS